MKNNDIKDSTRPMGLLSLILSFMALFVISGLLFFPIDHETRQVLIGLDFIICSIFLLQLTIDLIRSTDRWLFLKRHWIDFVASIPLIEPLRFARIFHIMRVVLVLRSSKFILHQLKENRRETTVASILLLMVILITLGSSAMLFIEAKNPEANIRTGARCFVVGICNNLNGWLRRSLSSDLHRKVFGCHHHCLRGGYLWYDLGSYHLYPYCPNETTDAQFNQ